MYSDQTGKFPAVLSKGNKYVMVLHDVNSNSLWAEPMKNQGGELILTCNRALTRMQQQGINPKHQILNNQASESYKDAIRASGMTYQLVPPYDHWRNMAKKAIQTFKDHFIGVHSGCAATMPIHLWCQLLPQNEHQLLLLRQLQLHPNLSAYAHVYEQHDYNKRPFVPIGMEAMVMTNPTSVEPLPNTAARLLCWAPPLNTTDAGNFRWSARGQPGSQAQHFSNINT